MAGSLALPLAAFLLGLASGVHCIGMCGGIVAAFSTPGVVKGPRDTPAAPSVGMLALFNTGRVAAYTLAGAAAGALGSAGAYAAMTLPPLRTCVANCASVPMNL